METMSLARVEEDITRLKVALSDVYARKNSFSSTFRLPTETLADIFIRCARDHYHYYHSHSTWFNVSYVCRHWRNVALNCPTFWSYISMIPRRWMEEMLVRSKKAPLKIRVRIPYEADDSWNTFKKVMNHAERIQEFSLHIPRGSSIHLEEVFSKLSLRAPLLQYLEISVHAIPSKMSFVLFDGHTPALRTLELSDCSVPWFFLKLSSLTTLSLYGDSVQLHQNMEEFVATLGCMQDLSHLYLMRVLPGSQGLVSGTTFNTSQKINLPRLSRLQIDDSLLPVIAFLSCVKIQKSSWDATAKMIPPWIITRCSLRFLHKDSTRPQAAW